VHASSPLHAPPLDTQAFSGPPESIREHILGAAKALQAGDWKRCTELVRACVGLGCVALLSVL
jgi:translation initiation factor 3 subunit C